MLNHFAPVLICTLNRHIHFKRCIESLAACTNADKTDLFIGLDYPLKESHWEGYFTIKDYIPHIKGFKTITIIEREKNYGPQNNFINGRDKIFEKFDRVIISEDDNVFSCDFLRFINNGLDLYKDRKDIFSISGYNYPVEIPKNYKMDIYLWMGFSGWGFGTWRDKWMKIDYSEYIVFENINRFLYNMNDVIRLNRIANHYIPGLIQMVEKNILHGDLYICMYLSKNKMYSIFPVVSRVRNTGHDGSGINCGHLDSNIYQEQEIHSDNKNFDLIYYLTPDEKIFHVLKEHFKQNFKSQFKTLVKLLLMNGRSFVSYKI